MNDIESLFVGGTLIAVLASGWAYVKGFCWRIINLFIERARFNNDVGNAIEAYFVTHMRRSPFGEKVYNAFTTFVRPLRRQQVVGYEELPQDMVVFWYGWRPIVIFSGQRNQHDGFMPTVLFIRFTFDAEQLAKDALAEWNSKRHPDVKSTNTRFRVLKKFGQLWNRQRPGGKDLFGRGPQEAPSTATKESDFIMTRRFLTYTVEELGDPLRKGDPFDFLALPPEADEVLEAIDDWIASEEWFVTKSVPWRLGVLATGLPGTGKSSMAKAIAQKYDLPVHSFEMSTFGNQDFVEAWSDILSQAPCMALFEDIDAIWEGRKNLGGEGALTFDCFLNCLSGAQNADGVLVFITTNHPEKLDEALGVEDADGRSSRPGRVDYILKLEALTEDCRRKIANRILSDCPQHIERIVVEGDGDVGAQFQLRCQQVAKEERKKACQQKKLSPSSKSPIEPSESCSTLCVSTTQS